ncbi:hypothetical protein L596_030107 [Steinernema carpocapsae]|uniref:Uncharacterized protein n=1 Tax=Steinernema carpocapsae TaxID=34508 RepID=A0A4U5LRR9_STECR|nr:hypothetical protein L596_030107 [Steinernema carpocapsae]
MSTTPVPRHEADEDCLRCRHVRLHQGRPRLHHVPFVTMQWNPGFFVYKKLFFSVHIIALLIVFALPLVAKPLKKEAAEAKEKKAE